MHGRPSQGRPDRPDRLGGDRRGDQREDAARSPSGPAPVLPDEAMPELLDSRVRRGLEMLGPELALRVGRHLAAAALALDEDPAAALAHARYARQRAPRLAETREALGVAAYAAGDFTLARAELRTARRMTGSAGLIPLLADCERALGRPAEAVALARADGVAALDRQDQLELLLVVAGARLDLGEPLEALRVLTVPELRADDEEALAEPAILRTWYVYAEVLAAAGRPEEAAAWFARVDGLDDEITDAGERLAALTAAPEG